MKKQIKIYVEISEILQSLPEFVVLEKKVRNISKVVVDNLKICTLLVIWLMLIYRVDSGCRYKLQT